MPSASRIIMTPDPCFHYRYPDVVTSNLDCSPFLLFSIPLITNHTTRTTHVSGTNPNVEGMQIKAVR